MVSAANLTLHSVQIPAGGSLDALLAVFAETNTVVAAGNPPEDQRGGQDDGDQNIQRDDLGAMLVTETVLVATQIPASGI